MNTTDHPPKPDLDPTKNPNDPQLDPKARPSEEPQYRPDDGKGGTYEKEGPRPPKGDEMPEIEERIEEGDERSARVKILHDPKRDNTDLDDYTDRVNERPPAEPNPDNKTAPRR
jgi:hypothetical protein